MKGLLSRMFNVIKKCMPKALWEKSKSMIFALASLGYAIQLLLYKDRVVIFDTPSYGNIGDQAILLSEIDYLRGLFLRKKIICVPMECIPSFLFFFSFLVKKNDLIFIQGGGIFGSIWKEEMYSKVINKFSENNIIVFPQTIFYEDDAYGRHRLKVEKNIFDRRDLKLFVRENQSFLFAEENLFKEFKENCVLIPDMVLSYRTAVEYSAGHSVVTCLRKDKEKVSSENLDDAIKKLTENAKQNLEETDMCINHAIRGWKNKRAAVDDKLVQLSKAKFVITDRLHCMIFCTLVGTPCIAMDNSSKKVKGVYEKWLKDLDYIVFCENENDALSKAEEWIKADSIQAIRYSPKNLESAFAPLTQAIKDSLA